MCLRGVGTSMPRSLSNTGSPLMTIRPRSGRRMPATPLTTEVLPAPERPNNAVTPSPASKAAFIWKAPSRRSMSTVSVIAHDPSRRAPHQHFRNIQRSERQQYRNETQPQRRLVSRRRLGKGIDRERQRARLAGDVGDERDGRAELAQAAREGQQHARDDSRQRERQGDGKEYADAAGAQCAGRGLEPAVDCLERKADRADHQREAHDARRERGTGPSKCDHYTEPFLEQRAERSAPAEEKQEEIYDHYRRQHQRQGHHRVEQRLPGKRCAGKQVRYDDPDKQTCQYASQ